MPQPDAPVIPSAQGDIVRVSESAVGSVRADRVVSRRTNVRHTHAQHVDADLSVMLMNPHRSTQRHPWRGGGATSGRTQVRNAAMGVNLSGNARLENVAASWVVAGNVQADRVLSLAVVGGNVSGNVRALFGTRAAIAFGIASASPPSSPASSPASSANPARPSLFRRAGFKPASSRQSSSFVGAALVAALFRAPPLVVSRAGVFRRPASNHKALAPKLRASPRYFLRRAASPTRPSTAHTPATTRLGPGQTLL